MPDPTTFADARAIVARFGLSLSQGVIARLAQDADETPKHLENTEFRLIATPAMALQACARTARGHGLTPVILGDAIEGESREAGTLMAGIARSVARHGEPVRPPALLLAGGETTVTIGAQTPGRGGRNTEFLLALALALNGHRNIWAIAGDTDGIDGTEDAAGALITPTTLARGHNARARLDAHDSYTFFNEINDLIKTGPTLTNINDIRAILIA